MSTEIANIQPGVKNPAVMDKTEEPLICGMKLAIVIKRKTND